MNPAITLRNPIVFVTDPAEGYQRACTLLEHRVIGEYDRSPVVLMVVEHDGEYLQVLRYAGMLEEYTRAVDSPHLPDPSHDAALIYLREWAYEFDH